MVRRLALLSEAITIAVVPLLAAWSPLVLSTSAPARLGSLVFGAVLYPVTYLLTCGLLSLPHHAAIKPGRFERSLTDDVYFGRRMYGLAWVAVSHSPFYWLYLSVPALKWLMFRLFGYRGQMDFVVHPDTWIRDLPLLTFGKGAYVANKATLGTNMPLADGTILVDRVDIGEASMIGHLAMVAAGSEIGARAQVGHGTALNARVTIGDGALIGPICSLDALSSVGRDSRLHSCCSLGMGATVGADLALPFGTVVRPRARIRRREDLHRHTATGPEMARVQGGDEATRRECATSRLKPQL